MLLSVLSMYKSGHNVMWIPIPKEAADIAYSMQVKVKRFGICPNLFNAYTYGSSIVIGKDLLDRLSVKETCAILSKE